VSKRPKPPVGNRSEAKLGQTQIGRIKKKMLRTKKPNLNPKGEIGKKGTKCKKPKAFLMFLTKIKIGENNKE